MRNKRLRSIVVMLLVLALGLSFTPVTSVAAEPTAKIAYVDGGYEIDSQGIVQSVNGQTKVDELVYKPGMRGCADNMVIKKLVFPESVDVAFKDFKLPNCGIIEFRGNDTVIDSDYINNITDVEHQGKWYQLKGFYDSASGTVNPSYLAPRTFWVADDKHSEPWWQIHIMNDLLTHQYVIVANKDSAVWKQAEKYHLYLTEDDTMRLTHDNITTRWGIKYRIALIGGFGENVQWSIADPSVATIVGDPSNGTAVITAGEKKGETTYTATCNGQTFTGTFKVERYEDCTPRIISKKRVTKTWYTDNGESKWIFVKKGGISYSMLNPKYKSYKHTKKVWKYKYDTRGSAEELAMRDWVLNKYAFKEDDKYTKVDRFGSWLSSYVFYQHYSGYSSGLPSANYDPLLYKNDKDGLKRCWEWRSSDQGSIACFEARKVVCGGVANSLLAVCKDLDVPCVYLIDDEGNHAWNKIQLSDGIWKEIDKVHATCDWAKGDYLQYTPLFDDGIARSFTTVYAVY